MNDIYKKEYLNSFKGKMTPELKAHLYERSMAKYCNEGKYPQADALFIQGFRDTIFPLNHAIDNQACTQKGVNAKHQRPNDARLLVMQGGHLLPTQKWTGMPIFNTEKTIHCEDQKINLSDVMVDWFDAKLLDRHEKVAHVPQLCMTQDYKTGIVADEMPIGGETIIVERKTIRPGMAGMFEVVAKPLEWLTGLPKSVIGKEKLLTDIEKETESHGGLLRPAFVPLKIADKDGVLAGVPKAELYFDTEKENVTLFTALGVKKPNSNKIDIVSEQILPLSGRGYHTTEMPGMSTRLQRGDVVGLVVYGTTGQYFLNRSFSATQVQVSGTMDLPLLRKSGQEYVAYSSPESIGNVAANDVSLTQGTGSGSGFDRFPSTSNAAAAALLE
jgi:ABC-2 type transport system ATP-binding protein